MNKTEQKLQELYELKRQTTEEMKKQSRIMSKARKQISELHKKLNNINKDIENNLHKKEEDYDLLFDPETVVKISHTKMLEALQSKNKLPNNIITLPDLVDVAINLGYKVKLRIQDCCKTRILDFEKVLGRKIKEHETIQELWNAGVFQKELDKIYNIDDD